MPRQFGITSIQAVGLQPAVPAAGGTYFNTANGRLYISNGTSWVQYAPEWDTIAAVGIAQTINSTTYANITDLVVPIANNLRYEFEATLICTVDSTTTGMSFTIATTGSVTWINYLVMGTSTATGARMETVITIGAFGTGAFLTAASLRGTIWIKGQTVVPAAGAGNLNIQAAKTTSGTGTVLAGSNFRIRSI
jgi:hypothetical protein